MDKTIAFLNRNRFISFIIGISLYGFLLNRKKKKIFISFSMKDKSIRDLLVGQSNNSKAPFEFVDKSVYDPWEKAWKTNCRDAIKECDGVIALISKNSFKATGQRWEIKCCNDEDIPLLLIYAYKDKSMRGKLFTELYKKKVEEWSWEKIISFIDAI